MKYRKIIHITFILSLFLINNHIHGQSKSKEELGNSLIESILSKNIDSFKALLLPQKVVLKLLENNAPENIDKEERDSLMTQSEATYNNIFIPQYENNFWEIVNLTETNEIDWSNLKFVVLYKYSSKEHEYNPFLIHTRLINSDYNHFYFSAVRYKGEWFLEDKMEITKDEKYAPND
ncbi:MAG: hypothetical protein KAH72_05005 [Flavobacteriaceae bacterium]|nr:hypothetical protein [Flavobacteriaceae bacterium]